jgi:2-methylcitrate dehydratase PrpD
VAPYPLTRELARQATEYRYEGFSPDVQLRVRVGLLDFMGVSLAGSREQLSQIVALEARDAGGAAQARVIGGACQVPAAVAARINGVSAHALDFDDVSLALSGHPSAVILPAVLALGEQLRSNGRELATAYIAGFETACRVGRMLMPSSQELGFHLTGVAGVFGAAAAAGRLLDLSIDQMVMALGIASSQAAGLRVDGGTMCKPLHAGRAAEAGILAARLAHRGFTARNDVLECDRGLISAFSRESPLAGEALLPEGVVHFTGSIFKVHAACFFVHAAIECGRQAAVRGSHRQQAAESISLTVHPRTFEACAHVAPVDALQSKRSLTHATALGMLDVRSDDPHAYGVAMLQEPTLLALRSKVKIVLDDKTSQTGAMLRVQDGNGAAVDYVYEAATPTRMDEPTVERLDRKFRTLAEPVLGLDRAVALMHRVKMLDEISDARELTEAAAVPS